MNRDFQVKFLQHLSSKKKADEGFTLIELLVVIIIIGILAAIALPSLLGQVNKARQAEARNNVGSVGRTQQAYFLENQRFAGDVQELQAGIREETKNYEYHITNKGENLNKVPIEPGTANALAIAKNTTLKNYVGLVGTLQGDPATGEVLTIGLVCEADQPSGKVKLTKTQSFGPIKEPANQKEDACEKSISKDWKDLS